MRKGFKKWSEQKSEDVRRDMGLQRYAPLHAADLAKQLKIQIISPQHIPNISQTTLNQLLFKDNSSWSAASFQFDGQFIVIHNSSHAPSRIESDLMHEIAHKLSDHRPTKIHSLDGIDIPLRSYDDEQEEEAKWLGACLQIPRCALLYCAYRAMENEEIARIYFASPSLVLYRRNVTGVDLQVRRTKF